MALMPSSWYASGIGTNIEQGDIFLDFPLNRITEIPEEGADIPIFQEPLDLIVLTQTCYIENGPKVEDILLALVQNYDSTADDKRFGYLRSKEGKKGLIEGNNNAFVLLPENDEGVEFGWSFVNFHYLYTVPYAYIQQIANSSPNRLRLSSPYLEHVSQSFAKYMMKVALPETLASFEHH